MIARCLESKAQTEVPLEESTHCIALQCGVIYILFKSTSYVKMQGLELNISAVNNLRARPQHVFTDGFESE